MMVAQEAITVLDDALPDPHAYREFALAQPYREIQTGDELWRGIARLDPQTDVFAHVLAAEWPGARTHLTFFRKSPLGQDEPNFLHSDEGMGEWTAILYLNPTPMAGDGTDFWRWRQTGDVMGSARSLPKDPVLWERWKHVDAQFGRLVLFDSLYFHSRAIQENYGEGDTARLVQVAFGTWAP